jgi:lipopolysaccharide/colanic/teichoic acid biosynthesis glycosyltransferase
VATTIYIRHGKRIFDLILTSGLLLILSPLLLLMALAIKLDSRGPVFYRQERLGRNGEPLLLWKFRSMVVGAETMGAGALVERNDSRITRVGQALRKLSLDELPQLFNVMNGSMSLIGPRPGLRYQVEQYDARQRQRLLLRPGITGWAQIHGRNAIPWDRRIQLDLEYLEKCSLKTDLYILLKTPAVVLSGQDRIAAADFWNDKTQREKKDSTKDTAANS